MYCCRNIILSREKTLIWDDSYNEYFIGRDVYILQDNDAIGQAYAKLEARKINTLARVVYIIDLAEAWPEIPKKGDVSDMIECLGKEDAFMRFQKLCSRAVPWEDNLSDIPDSMDKLLDDIKPIYEAICKESPEISSEYNDQLMGRLFAKVFKKELRFNVTAKEWMFYNGCFWEMDTGGMIAAQKAKLLTDALLLYASQVGSKDFTKFAALYGQLSRRKTMLEDARSECFIRTEDFDKQDNYLNLLNGTMDLRTFELIEHSPEHLLSKIANVEYDPKARSQDFEKYITEIMQGNEAKILYLQKTLGLALTTDTSLETCWMWYGPTSRNGKGTLAEIIGYMLGNTSGYAMTTPPETLAQRKKDTRQASGDIARLNGCRFLNISEPPKRMLFDAALLKTLLGRDTITARNLFEREFEFVPKFHLFINTNHLPRIQDDSVFESGRINIITFDRHFEPEEQDQTLKDRLRKPENISGIFNWCLDGLRVFRETGLTAPEEVKNATVAYREASDKIANFIDDCLDKTGRNSAAGEVYRHYASWCSANGYGVENKRSFFDELRNKSIFAELGTVNGLSVKNVVVGYEILDDFGLTAPERY